MREYDDEDKGRRDDIKTIKARVKTLEAALRDIQNRTNNHGENMLGSEVHLIYLSTIRALGQE